jgi:L-lysine exporter family protein LysE/ArgO
VTTPQILTALTTGGLFSLSLIVAIGPQNAFVMRHGMLRSHIGTVVTLCAGSDAILITAGVVGVGAALTDRHWLFAALRAVGATLLVGYGALAAYRAVRHAGAGRAEAGVPGSKRAAVAACLAFTWLNPAVYLDTVILLGSVANAQPTGRWWFTIGAVVASTAWFTALGFGTRLLAPLLRRPRAEQMLDGFVAATMGFAALRLLLGS